MRMDGQSASLASDFFSAAARCRIRRRRNATIPGMTALKYLQAYPAALQDKVRELIAQQRLGDHLASRYPQRHAVQSDKALYAYTMDLKQQYLKNAPGIDKVIYDSKLDVVQRALGLHTAISRVQGGKLKAKKEIRVAALFKAAAPEFLQMIVVHELAHLKELDHNKPFYQLCQYMLPDYHQLEFDLRVYLTWRDLPAAAEHNKNSEDNHG
jgi:predicted metal-dependent hydrolase